MSVTPVPKMSAARAILRIHVSLSPEGLLRGFEARGHAGSAPAGENLACAAATVLLRSAARACAARGLASGGGAKEPGDLKLSLARASEPERGWLRGVTDMLLRGVDDLQRDHPGAIEVELEGVEP